MTNSTTKTPLRVLGEGTSRGQILVPVSQLEQVQALLEANQVGFWVDQMQISVDNKPPFQSVFLRRGTDLQRVQALLDVAE